MCLVYKPRITDYWSTDVMLDPSFAGNTMKRDKLCSIYFMLHVNNSSKYTPRGQPNHDPIHKIIPFYVKSSKAGFYPGGNITINEGMCPFRGRINILLYIKYKPSKYSIVFIISDASTGYVLNSEIYTGVGDNDNCGVCCSAGL